MQYVLYGLIALIVAFLAVILIRTAAFKPRKNVELLENEESFDKEKAVESLRELVKCKTVSSYTRELEDDAEFEKLISKLPKLYPNVNEKCPLTKMEDRGLLFKWEGKAHDAPAVMMAHYDVVPVNEDMWEKPPFEAILEDGVLWGRGT
ncbi:MAG: M20/M25/M40 family metallo-hydrolase, partial [Oscillospiraceae bacterium]|nr:M20/M25/M40 family metallo-hydrolase [Oscillospiraceae bacterium]